jgi:hypothetical protein
MKTIKTCLASALLAVFLVGIADAMPLNSSARAVVPADLQQLISVDYRALKDSPTAMQLKEQLMPDNIKEFEAALKGVGIDPNKDVDTLTFASFRTAKQGIKGVGVAAGPFAMKAVIKKMTLRKIKPTKYRLANIYPMDGGMVMTFLDDSTLLFGEISAVKLALDTRDGDILNLDTNSIMSDMMSGPTGHAERDALGPGRSLQGRRLRYHQETLAGFALQHELYQRRELRSYRGHFRYLKRCDAVFPSEGRSALQEDER